MKTDEARILRQDKVNPQNTIAPQPIFAKLSVDPALA